MSRVRFLHRVCRQSSDDISYLFQIHGIHLPRLVAKYFDQLAIAQHGGIRFICINVHFEDKVAADAN
jgi:hypothetical protein